jgi:benzoylformate decarboxylase
MPRSSLSWAAGRLDAHTSHCTVQMTQRPPSVSGRNTGFTIYDIGGSLAELRMNHITGRSAFLALLKDEGITHLFGNPGTTELPIMHALKDHPELTYVMAMQESLVVAIADGFSRASGRLVACNVHVAPGLGNAMGALYNASFTGTPMILTAGQQEQGHGLMEPMLYGPLVRIAEPLVKWAIEVTRLDDLPRIVRRAAKIATTPPTGPVFISLPGDILNNEGAIDLGRSTRVNTRVKPSDETLAKLVEKVLSAKRPMIVVGDEVVKSDALVEAAQFAETLGCPVFQQSVPFGAHFLSESPCFIGALSRVQKQIRELLGAFDLMIVLGAEPLRMSVYSEVEPLPEGMPIVQIGLVDDDLAKNYPVEFAVKADVRETLRALTPALAAAGSQDLVRRAGESTSKLRSSNWSARRKVLIEEISAKKDCSPIDPDWLTLQMLQAMPSDAILVDEGLTSARYVPALRAHRDRYGYHGLASGGIGWGLPASVGVSLASPTRPVVCYSGDGSAMYSIQALWTATHHRLPLTVVIANNGGYRIIKQRLLAFHKDKQFVGMDFADPPVDFVGLATALGAEAIRVTRGQELAAALQSAMSRPGTKLVDVQVDGSVNS